MRVMVVVQRQAELLEVVRTLRPPGRLAGLLYGRHEERREHRDDGDHHQQLDQRKAGTRAGRHLRWPQAGDESKKL